MNEAARSNNAWAGYILTLMGLAGTTTAIGADWTQWGGPDRNFKVASGRLADKWPDDGPKRLWERELGAGYSAIVAAGDNLYTMYRDGDHDVVVALDAKSGKTNWEYKYASPTHEGQKLDFGKGPNATPLIAGDQIITVGFGGLMHCLSRSDGKLIWKHDLVKDFGGKIQEFGYSPSPLLYKGDVIVLVGGDKHGVIALNPKDGALVWGGEAIDISYASPRLINVDGQDQIAFFTSTTVVGVDAASGKKLWDHPVINQYKNSASDIIWGDDNRLWAASQLDGGTRVLRLTRSGDQTNVQEEWMNPKVQVFHWNAVRVGDFVYASIGGQVTMLAGVNVKTGEVAWRERGFQKAMCVYAEEKLISLDEDGMLRLSRVSSKGVEVLSSVQLTEKASWTPPTLVSTTLFVRDTKRILALDLGQ